MDKPIIICFEIRDDPIKFWSLLFFVMYILRKYMHDTISDHLAQLPKELQNYIIDLALRSFKQRPYELLDNVPYSQRELIWSSQSRCSFPPLTFYTTYAHCYNILRICSGMGGRCYSN